MLSAFLLFSDLCRSLTISDLCRSLTISDLCRSLTISDLCRSLAISDLCRSLAISDLCRSLAISDSYYLSLSIVLSIYLPSLSLAFAIPHFHYLLTIFSLSSHYFQSINLPF